jgi:hypothetical protein
VASAIKLSCLALAASTIVAGVAALPGHATPAVLNCGSLSLGPGNTERGAVTGARCLLRAYGQHCEPAVYALSLFGVDTIATDHFRLARESGRCLIEVTMSFRIVPQPARQHSGVCRTLALKSRQVVAGRCTGASIPASIVLDPKP